MTRFFVPALFSNVFYLHPPSTFSSFLSFSYIFLYLCPFSLVFCLLLLMVFFVSFLLYLFFFASFPLPNLSTLTFPQTSTPDLPPTFPWIHLLNLPPPPFPPHLDSSFYSPIFPPVLFLTFLVLLPSCLFSLLLFLKIGLSESLRMLSGPEIRVPVSFLQFLGDSTCNSASDLYMRNTCHSCQSSLHRLSLIEQCRQLGPIT